MLAFTVQLMHSLPAEFYCTALCFVFWNGHQTKACKAENLCLLLSSGVQGYRCLGIFHTRRAMREPKACVLSPTLALDPEKTGDVCRESAGTDGCRIGMTLSSSSLGPKLHPSPKTRSIRAMSLQLAGLTRWNMLIC